MSIVQTHIGNAGNAENVTGIENGLRKKKPSGLDVFSKILGSKLAQGNSSLKGSASLETNALNSAKSKGSHGMTGDAARKMNPGQGVLNAKEKGKPSELTSSAFHSWKKTESVEKKGQMPPDEKHRLITKSEAERNEEKRLVREDPVPKEERLKAKKTKGQDDRGDESRLSAFMELNRQNIQSVMNHGKPDKKRDSESDGAIAEATPRKRGTDRDKMTLSVNDQRKAELAESVKATEKESVKTVSDGSQEREIRIVLRDSQGGRGQETVVRTERKETPFRAMLERELRDTYNTEIAKSGSIILRDGGAGTIRLALKPESMGNVKFELNLAENSITGTIVVENDEVKESFERNLSSLEAAFKAQGFDSAKLAVSIGGQNAGNSGSRNEGDDAKPFFSDRLRQVSGARLDHMGEVLRDGALDIIV